MNRNSRKKTLLKKILAGTACGLFAQGCVSAGTHQKLQDDYNKQTSALGDCNTKLQTDEGKLHDQETIITDLESKLGASSSARTKLESNVAEMKTALEALKKQRSEAEQRIADFTSLVNKFKSLTDTGKLSVKIVNGQMIVALSSDVLFPPGSAELSATGAKSISDVTQLLVSVADKKFQVVGHTDNKPIRTVRYPSNWELASARSLTVLKTMLNAGMPAERISAATFGETQPVATNDTDEGRAANRRIEIVIVPDLSQLPGYDELQKISNQPPAAGT